MVRDLRNFMKVYSITLRSMRKGDIFTYIAVLEDGMPITIASDERRDDGFSWFGREFPICRDGAEFAKQNAVIAALQEGQYHFILRGERAYWRIKRLGSGYCDQP